MLVVLSFTLRWWGNGTRVVGPVMLISLLFGLIDGLKASATGRPAAGWSLALPLNEQGLARLPPSLCALLLAALWDRLQGRPQVASVSKSAA